MEKKDVCPNCGYCPHCGRSAQPVIVPSYPIYPIHPGGWWGIYPPYYVPSQTICNPDGSSYTYTVTN